MRLAWATDVHLNFLDAAEVAAFAEALANGAPDAVLLAGDIAEAPDLEAHLATLATRLARPVYFVLGNHDFYRGSVAGVRRAMAALSARSPSLRWLPAAGVVALTAATGLVGHDGWGDARLGDPAGTPLRLNDFVLIEELAGLDRASLHAALRAFGDEAAAHLRAVLAPALARFARVVVVTHVPPFREACWHAGQVSGDDWLPYFTCKAVGDVLLEAARARPDRRITVLCGHTHGAGVAAVLPNLTVHTGGAEYGAPEVQPALVVD